MYLIDRDKNSIKEITRKTFSELGFRERDHLQEWIAKYPSALGEDLLIIQKEFNGFSDTNERLDLLALDKQGNLVIIENKLDDSGKDVTWQCLKYASYCSSLKKSHIVTIFQEYLTKTGSEAKAEDLISEFLDDVEIEELNLNTGSTQRLILLAGAFRKEVTSTVMWLLNYGIRIQCFQATPYELDGQLFLNIDQIIPMRQAEDFAIGMAEKTQEQIASQEETKHRHVVRRKFWRIIIDKMNAVSDLYQNISPGKFNWISAGSGVRGVGFNFAATRSYGRAEIYIDRGDKEENEFVFDYLYASKNDIEEAYGRQLVWERLEERRGCRIKDEYGGMNIFDEATWSEGVEFMTEAMCKMEKVFKEYLLKLRTQLR